MPSSSRTLAGLKIGDTGIIKSLKDTDFSLQLMDMGCIPGTEITMCGQAPFGGPIKICICGYNLSLRKREAELIELKDEENN